MPEDDDTKQPDDNTQQSDEKVAALLEMGAASYQLILGLRSVLPAVIKMLAAKRVIDQDQGD